MSNINKLNKCKNELCDGHGKHCDYVLDGYMDECCDCEDMKPSKRCADYQSDLIDRAIDLQKDIAIIGF